MRRYVQFAFAIALIITAPVCRAQETVTLPAFTPVIGAKTTYAVHLQSTFESTGAFPIPKTTSYGEFRRSVTAASKTDDRIAMVWTLSADLPAAANSSPAGDYMLNYIYWQSLTFWNVKELAVETDLAGHPMRLPDWPRIRDEAEAKIRQQMGTAPVQPDSVLAKLQAMYASNPLVLVDILLPETTALERGQADAPATIAIGVEWEAERVSRINGVEFTARTRWAIERVDQKAQTATYAWTDEFDPADIARAFKPALDNEIAALGAKNENIFGDRRRELATATMSSYGRVEVSLRDGSMVSAEDIRESRVGPYKTQVTLRLEKLPD
ncbi:hypothetical protein [Terrarubrum flagellatum]|uniref:hypothetical protein n=1 Tax=Terrirubrum flagellatum TaxID=2895980 RepID=UPI0031454651